MGLLIVPPQTRWQVLLSTAFDGAPDAAGAVRRGGLRLLQCGRYARARRCEDRTPRHAVAYAAVYKAGAALRSAMRPALRGPHTAARCSIRRRLQGRRCTAFDGAPDAAGAVRRGGLHLLQCGRYACARRCEDRTPRHAVAYVAVYKAGGALRSAVRPTLQAPCDVAVSASCDAGATLAPGAAKAARRGTL